MLFLILLLSIPFSVTSVVLPDVATEDNLIQQLLNKQNAYTDPNNQYKDLTTSEIVKMFGYPIETHYVTTVDGYILQLHRIPRGMNISTSQQKTRPRPAVLVQHGMLLSSSDWVMDKPDRALGYLLADAGYDVWMSNFRGNTYGRNHTKLDPDENKLRFWDFSWDDMALKDLPNVIDFILSRTGQTQLHYVGFSLSTTTLFALVGDKAEYADKIKAAALMGPVAYLDHLKGPLREAASHSKLIYSGLYAMGHHEILRSGEIMDWSSNLCKKNTLPSILCYNILFLLCGYDYKELNKDYLPIIISHTPAGTSLNTINHYMQLFNSGIFRKYDYGIAGNLLYYGRRTPPKYNLSANIYPTGLFWGQNDWMATPEDVKKLASELPNVVVNYKIERSRWNHLDFVWGIHAKEYVYNQVIEFLNQY